MRTALDDPHDVASMPTTLRLLTAQRPGKDMLVRALGKTTGVKRVIDATAGLGHDASALAWAGYEVLALERAPLLVNLWQQATLPERLQFLAADAIQYLLTHPTSVDAVYIDPMYVHDEKRTARKKARILEVRAAVGEDADQDALFDAAMRAAIKRVVVKRPVRAPALRPGVTHAFTGRSTRFDMYLVPPILRESE